MEQQKKLVEAELLPYLPYDLNIDPIYRSMGYMGGYMIKTASIDLLSWVGAEEITPHLRPMEDLVKDEWESIFATSDIDKILSCWQSDKNLGCVEYYLVNLLLSNHFDIFDLISKGVAKNINHIKTN